MPNFTYRCDRGHETDAVRRFSVASIPCRCGGEAKRLSVYATYKIERERKLPGKDFIEASEELADRQDTAERREGMKLPQANLWAMAQARANDMIRKGYRVPQR